jgi:hypothetical protein
MIKFKKPDLNAPRFKKKRESILKDDFYKELKLKYSKCKDLTKEDIRTIIEAFNNEIVNTIIEDPNGFELPEGLGYIFIATTKVKKKKVVDYKNSHAYGVLVTHKNWETDGYVGKIVYTNYKAKYRFRNAPIWGFTASRTFSRKMSKAFKEKWNTYRTLIPGIKPSVYKN